MAITSSQRKKIQKYLVILLVILLVSIGIVVWWGFFKEKTLPPVSEEVSTPKIEIDLSLFENPQFNSLQPFEKFTPPEKGEAGRENPFLFSVPPTSPE